MPSISDGTHCARSAAMDEETGNENKVRRSARRPSRVVGKQGKTSRHKSVCLDRSRTLPCECCLRWHSDRRYCDNLPGIGKSPHEYIWPRDPADIWKLHEIGSRCACGDC